MKAELSILNRFFGSKLFAPVVIGSCFFGFALLVHLNLLTLGGGDESHRAAISISVSENPKMLYSMFRYNPWGLAPFILQALLVTFLKLLGIKSYLAFLVGFSFSFYAATCSLIANLIISNNGSSAKKNILFSFLLLLSSASSILLTQVSNPMGEPYGVYFLILGFSILRSSNLSLTSSKQNIIVGLLWMVASQCRNEYIIPAILLCMILKFSRGFKLRSAVEAGIILLIMAFPTILKALITLFESQVSMSYFNLAHYANFDSTFLARLEKALTACFDSFKVDIQLWKILIFTSCFGIYQMWRKKELPSKSHRTAVLLFLAGIIHLFALIFIMSFKIVLPFPRYFVGAQILILPLLAYLLIRCLSERSTAVFGLVAMVYFIPVLRGSIVNRYHISPPGFKEGITQLRNKLLPGNKVVIDSLLFNESLIYAIAREKGIPDKDVCMIYSCNEFEEDTVKEIPNASRAQKRILNYIKNMRPSYAVLPGPKLQAEISRITFFYDKEERSGYIYPFLTTSEENPLSVLSLDGKSSAWFKNIFQNDHISIYELTYNNSMG